MIKIILSDIDGTFLKHDKSISELHVKAIKKILAQGIKFAFVSARMPEAIYPITDGINLPHTPVISYSGALVLTETEEILYDKKISIDDTKNILPVIERNWKDIAVNYYTGRKWYVRQIDLENKYVQYEIKVTQASTSPANFENLISENILPNKILIMCEPPTCEEMERKLGAQFPNLNVVRSARHLLEIMDKSVSKATGIKILLEHYNLKIEEAVAFGDNYNDTEMLQYIPQSVAMKNAPAEIQKIASAVTDSNEDGGIFTYLNKIGLL
ncbi:MAG: HAD family phosphatase [Selenomonadaceae bacterium]|nr:HAD family phosphatase [Selenomonadaceae bacterium]